MFYCCFLTYCEKYSIKKGHVMPCLFDSFPHFRDDMIVIDKMRESDAAEIGHDLGGKESVSLNVFELVIRD